MGTFAETMLQAVKDKDVSIMSEGKSISEFTKFIDSGSYVFNALLSGSMYGGIPNTKVLGLAGETTTGKTFFAISFINAFLHDNPKGAVVYYLAEPAVTREMMEDRGIDTSRVLIVDKSVIEDVKEHTYKVLKAYLAIPEKDREPLIFVLDSLGACASRAEINYVENEKGETADMKRTQQVKSLFRVITPILARAKVPWIVTNHTYDNTSGYGEKKKVSGGGGFLFLTDEIITLSKAKDKDDDGVNGVFITAKTFKSRFSKQNQEVEMRLSYTTGLDRYYGLIPIALKYDIFKKVGNKIVVADGTSHNESEINKKPEKYYTKDVMGLLEKACNEEFSYGVHSSAERQEQPIESGTNKSKKV